MDRPDCPFCSATSVRFLVDRADQEYGVPTLLSYHRCTRCRAVFVAPLPSSDEISGFYTDYSTHGAPESRSEGLLARWSRRRSESEFDAAAPRARELPVLDYGCGDGNFLESLQRRGYRALHGYDFDPAARQAARGSGAEIVNSSDELQAAGPFGTITLNHVIEHLAEPARDVARLGDLLTPGGRIVIRTPNARSVLSRFFGESWRGWETPRHLHVFTPDAVRALAAQPRLSGLRLVSVSTSEAMFLGIFHESLRGERWQRPFGKLVRHGLAVLALPVLSLLARVAPVGEELVVVLERP